MKYITQTDIYIAMEPCKRLAVATELFDFTFEYLKTYFRHKYPKYSQEKILDLVRQRITYGREENISKNDNCS